MSERGLLPKSQMTGSAGLAQGTLLMAAAALLVLVFALPYTFSVARALESPGAQAGLIQIKPVVEISGHQEEILLGDIMEMRGVSHDVANAISSVRLADAPGYGESRAFTDLGLSQIIRDQLDRATRKTGERVSVRIPSRVTVTKKVLKLSATDVEREIKAQLKGFCADCEFEISGLNLPLIGAHVPEGSTWTIKLRTEIPKGSFSLPLEVTHVDGTRRLYWISGQVSVRRIAPVAARAAMIGEKLSPEDFNMQMKDVTFSSDVPATSAEIASSVVGRQVASGQVIWRSQLRREQAIRGGDAVKVIAGTEEWQVSIDGVAQNGGYIGELVRVKIPRTQKIVSGLVKDKGLIEVR